VWPLRGAVRGFCTSGGVYSQGTDPFQDQKRRYVGCCWVSQRFEAREWGEVANNETVHDKAQIEGTRVKVLHAWGCCPKERLKAFALRPKLLLKYPLAECVLSQGGNEWEDRVRWDVLPRQTKWKYSSVGRWVAAPKSSCTLLADCVSRKGKRVGNFWRSADFARRVMVA
jgi:hypothetical protein